MPLVLLCGFPASGKSTRCSQMKEHFEGKGLSVAIVSDESEGIDKNAVYSESVQEKNARGTLKSRVQRLISKEAVIILDSLNYIKGFRYELFCVAKNQRTPSCVVYCISNSDKSKELNASRPSGYTPAVLDALIARFEEPDSRNRWDSPLFTVLLEDSLPLKQIEEALFQAKAPKPNRSTQSQPLSSADFLYEVDRRTQEVVEQILERQSASHPGEAITVLGSAERVAVDHTLTLAELKKWRKQFLEFTKMHPINDADKVTTLFVQFVNNALSR